MPIPISQLPPDLVWNGQLDISNPIKRTKYEQLNREWEQSNRSSYTPASTSQPTQKPEDIINAIMEAQKAEIEAEVKLAGQLFGEDNAFAFDEYTARESAKAEYEPYYSELLEDYLQDVSLKRETIEDETKLLRDLYRLDTQKASREYERAVGRAEEGFAGQGMFYSGIKKRALGEAEVEYGAEKERSGEVFGAKERGLGREMTDLERSEYERRRDIFGGAEELGGVAGLGERGGEYQAALEGGILQRREEGLKEYYTPRLQQYFRRFPTSGGGALKGYVPEQFLRY